MKTVAVFSMYNPGRINPLVAIIEELTNKENCRVVFYGDVSTKDVITKSGAIFRNWYWPIEDKLKDFPYPDDYFQYYRKSGQGLEGLPPFLWRLEEALLYLDELMLEVKSFEPDLIFYDPACIEAVTISEVYKIPRVSHITTSGKGVFGDKNFKDFSGTSWQSVITTDNAICLRNTWRKKYGFDPMHHGLPWQFYSHNLSIVSLVPELCIELDEDIDPFVYLYNGPCKPQVYVGPCISKNCRVNGNYTIPDEKLSSESTLEDIERKRADSEELKAIMEEAAGDFPMEELIEARRNGKKVVYFSVGTVIVGMLWKDAKDMTIGGAPSGKAFLQRMCKNLMEGLKDQQDLIVVLNIGMKPDALDFLQSAADVPSNFIIRQKSPQVQALEVADVFVTHGGAGSTNEACLSATPTVILPGMGDQLSNGRTLVKREAGIMYWNEAKAYDQATPELLQKAVLECLNDSKYAENTKKLGDSCRQSGGQAKAADILYNML